MLDKCINSRLMDLTPDEIVGFCDMLRDEDLEVFVHVRRDAGINFELKHDEEVSHELTLGPGNTLQDIIRVCRRFLEPKDLGAYSRSIFKH